MKNNEIMELTKEIKQQAIDVGFVDVGITRPEQLSSLYRGPVEDIALLQSPEEELPGVQSVILLSYYAWDPAFNIAVDATYVANRMNITPLIPKERYQLYYELIKHKAWQIVDTLQNQDYTSHLSLSIPLKPAAVQCGLGYQGKNTLLVTPKYGPRVRLIAVLTAAPLICDAPFTENLCQDCDRCIQACPTQALKPYLLTIKRCLTYAVESPEATQVPQDVREREAQLIKRPTPHSYIECAICIDACPIGQRARKSNRSNTCEN